MDFTLSKKHEMARQLFKDLPKMKLSHLLRKSMKNTDFQEKQ